MVKGISPLVATFLLIAFTLVVAGILAGWATQIATQQRVAAEYCQKAGLIIKHATYDTATSTLSLIVENIGSPLGAVDLNFTVSYVFTNGSGANVGQTFLAPKYQIVPVSFTVSSDIEEVSIRGIQCPGVTDSLRRSQIKNLGF
jgi:flagellin-like protein